MQRGGRGEGFTIYLVHMSNKSVDTGEQTLDKHYFMFHWLSFEAIVLYIGSILFSSFKVYKTVANHPKLPEIMMSNLAAPTDFLQI